MRISNRYSKSAPPIRSELFSAERLELHAHTLAEAQKVGAAPSRRPALPKRLTRNAAELITDFRLLARAANAGKPITSAGEWFLDNFHIVEEQVREVQHDLPPSFYRELPRLMDGPLAGYPRVYGIAWALVAHTDSAFDLERLERFVSAYQQIAPLKIGELWAIAITLRLTLVENLRRLTQIVVTRVSDGERAETVARQILARLAAGEDSVSIDAVLDGASVSAAFLTRIEQRLRGQGPGADRVIRDIEGRLAAQGMSSEGVIQEEYQAQSADDISVRNIITAMRLVSNIDWPEFFESVSLVDQALERHPGYRQMDFTTRDRYRRAVERIARRAKRTETDVAAGAAAAADRALTNGGTIHETDPGYYLIGKARRDFARSLGYTPSARERLVRLLSRTGLWGYLASIAGVTLVLTAIILALENAAGIFGGVLVYLGVLALLPASDLAIALINRAVTNRFQPQCLPALALKDGVPPNLRTALVVPVLLTRADDIARQVQQLEVHYLSNTDAELTYVLLSDWVDSETEHAPDDQALLDCARDHIAALNAHYATGRAPLFLLLHRRRQWNNAQGRWIGWERKRGKLHEFNRLLRGATDTSFLDIDGCLAQLPRDVRFVITLDADTRLPRGAAKRLIGKMAHPLNAPLFGPAGRVVAGHGILQPRVTPSLPIGAESSLFQWAFSGPNGLDPYAFAVSDVYQDLFEEGSFVGKGIYDVDVFEKALEQRIPDNTILSHDLLEGIFARAALVSDIEVVEEFPSRYDVEVSRQHRWVRGDWQLLPWVFDLSFLWGKPGIPALGRWKILDNMRRSLGAPALLLAILSGMVLPHDAALAWTLFLVFVMTLPPLLPILGGLVPHHRGFSRRGHFRNLLRDFLLACTQILFTVAFLARVAFLSLDAILRTLFRLFISRRNLLEWMTFAQSAYSRRDSWRATLLQLAGSVAFAAAAIAFVTYFGRPNLPLSLCFLTLWGFSPVVARWASQSPRVEPHLEITLAEADALRLAARRTWSYFERFVTAEEQFLPPDNFQEDPRPLVARRTSPTNIGVYLCAVLAARDFGWIGSHDAVARLEATLATMRRLERCRGHFLNWYATADLSPLEPRYISSVDSGNLAGNLLVVRNACDELGAPVAPSIIAAGLKDNFALLRQGLAAIPARHPARARADAMAVTIRHQIGEVPDLAQLEKLSAALLAHVGEQAGLPPVVAEGVGAFRACVTSHLRDQAPDETAGRLTAIATETSQMVEEMEFSFLFDTVRQLLSIGYRVDDAALDANAYDLLASEARLASFIAIAKGDIPTRHWFRLGRTLTPLGRTAALQSWSGSMFEYLMPALIMHEPPGSLLALSNRAAVRRQIRYATSKGLPWGISESQYNARDREQNYQYSSFGVPDLGIKRGLGENLVIAPYATGLAAMVAPREARRNLDRLTRLGALGAFGWYEAIDYTRARLAHGADHAVIKAYMAHHQGMMVLGLADVLCDGAMRERFHRDPMVKSAELLLQERMPRDVSVARLVPAVNSGAVTYHQGPQAGPRTFKSPHTPIPRTHLLSNGEYNVMVTAAGGGYSRWRGMALTRWQEDPTRDSWGQFLYLRDLRTGKIWSAAHQPVGAKADDYEATFSEDRANIKRVDGSLVTLTEICVSPEDNAEVRRVSITNNGTRTREIEVTSYMELALAAPADDDAHPAFSKLFVQTEYLRDSGALLATRRRRTPTEPPVWAAHLSVVDGDSVGDVQYETDRGKFLTRNRTARNAAAIFGGWPLSNSAGSVLDPVFSLRRRVVIPRGRTVTIAFWTLAADSRDKILDLVDRHHGAAAFERAATLAATFAQSQLQYLGVTGDEPHLFQALANYAIYTDTALRAPTDVLAGAAPPPDALWPLGISGDRPIVLARLSEDSEIGFVRQLVRAHDYWRMKRLAVDLVILNERASSYAQDLQHTLDALVNASDRPADEILGRVYLVRCDLAGPQACRALRAAARIDLSARAGTLAEQLAPLLASDQDGKAPPLSAVSDKVASPANPPADLQFFNGIGGFTPDGREYVTLYNAAQPTPAPWVNVIANPNFGFQVSTEGAGFSWSANSQQNQITPWSNDPVSNTGSEAFYLKDLASGDVWSPMPFPAADPIGQYQCRHGQGYSRFEYAGRGLSCDTLVFAAPDDPVKITRLTLRNTGAQPRNLSLTAYVQWCLGPSRAAAAPYIVTDKEGDMLCARNAASADFGGRVAFIAMPGHKLRFTADRREFLGRNGSEALPAALGRDDTLSGRTGMGLDPCGVLQTDIALAPGEEVRIVVLLGQGRDRAAAQALGVRYAQIDPAAALAQVTGFWNEVLSTVTITTPDAAMDMLANRWLLYQTLSCRMWGRAGFYQVSGAYGFRDQLQDSMALCLADPKLAREHLLRAGGRQFLEGDVQHWWLAERGNGIRTRISDDKSWLGYVAAHYIETTGDNGVLDEMIPFLSGPVLRDDQHDNFFQPETTHNSATLYEHCARALDASLAVGMHGLPLMGTGDWNDGMNRVGEQGRGESVWLGWFLHNTLARFIRYAEDRHDVARVARWLVHMDALHTALEDHAWDGDWYRRAFFDDGFALGSAANRECRIDAIAQTWSVLSGVGAPDRQRRAMQAMEKYLLRSDESLMTLFTPPFVASQHDPGYIKGYPAGVRENGGQYTHGVLWGVAAFATLGDGDKAGEMFAMLNPINHSRSPAALQRYRVEPYVACGDVYSVAPNVGRGGWTWYTGSAAWMVRVAQEYMLGLKFEGGKLALDPAIPARWPGFEAVIRRGAARYRITVDNPLQVCRGVVALSLDGQALAADARIDLADDGAEHHIHAVLGYPELPAP